MLEGGKAMVAYGKRELAEAVLGYEMPKVPQRPIVKVTLPSKKGRGGKSNRGGSSRGSRGASRRGKTP
jgi:hypothetical protein